METMRVIGISVLLAAATISTRPQAQAPAPTQVPRSQLPELNRPTLPTDQQPLFDFDTYFIGAKWTFEWDVPEGVLGAGGTVKGTTVYRKISDRFYEADTEGTGDWGAFKVKELIAYDKEYKSATRYVTDSRGFSYMQTAHVGGDLGGYYSLYFEGAPFTYKGQTLRINNPIRLFSPAQFQANVMVSIDKGPFRRYGDLWLKREGAIAR